MRPFAFLPTLLLCMAVPLPSQAGLYVSPTDPPAPENDPYKFAKEQLSGLRNYGPPDMIDMFKETRQREIYTDEANKLRKKEPLTAEEHIRLTGYLIRLQKFPEAEQALRAAYRRHPTDFFILSNYGTYSHLTGDLTSAETYLREAIRRAPDDEKRRFEEYHLQLVTLRKQEGRIDFDSYKLDGLFSVRFVGESGEWEAGNLAESQRARLPQDAMRIVQQLLLWMPHDRRLSWLFAELANARGDLPALQAAQHIYTPPPPTPNRPWKEPPREVRFRLARLQAPIMWGELAARIPTKERQYVWATQLIGWAANKSAASPDLAPNLVGLAQLAPRPRDLTALVSDDPDEGAKSTGGPPASWIPELSGNTYAIIGVGTLFVVILLALQIREMIRRRGARTAPALRQSRAEAEQP